MTTDLTVRDVIDTMTYDQKVYLRECVKRSIGQKQISAPKLKGEPFNDKQRIAYLGIMNAVIFHAKENKSFIDYILNELAEEEK